MFLGTLTIFVKAEVIANYSEVLVTSVEIPNYCLARHGINPYLVPNKKIMDINVYNVLPTQIFRDPTMHNKEIYFNIAGKHLCHANNKITACQDKTKGLWIYEKQKDGTYRFKTPQNQCLTLGNKNVEQDVYNLLITPCNSFGKSQLFKLFLVTTYADAQENVKYLDNKGNVVETENKH